MAKYELKFVPFIPPKTKSLRPGRAQSGSRRGQSVAEKPQRLFLAPEHRIGTVAI
jgi:hypothetical protein